MAGLYFDEVENSRIVDCQMCNTDIFARKVKGFIIDRVSSVVKDLYYVYAMCQLGASDTDVPARECILKDSTFVSHPASDEASSILISHAEGVLVEGCTARNDAFNGSIFAIGGQDGAATKNVKVTNCIFAGPAAFNLAVEAPEGITHSGIEISECLLEEALVANLAFQGPGYNVGCVVKNNTIQNGFGVGIETHEHSVTGCSFVNNTIANNCEGSLHIAEDCTVNLTTQNMVFRNGSDIINDGSSNLLYANTEFSNDLECASPSDARKRDPTKQHHAAKPKRS